jgi:hypothetical protein
VRRVTLRILRRTNELFWVGRLGFWAFGRFGVCVCVRVCVVCVLVACVCSLGVYDFLCFCVFGKDEWEVGRDVIQIQM